MDWTAVATALGSLLAGGVVAYLAALRSPSEGAVSAERRRLRTEILGDDEGIAKIRDIARSAMAEALADPEIKEWIDALTPDARNVFMSIVGRLISQTVVGLGKENLSLLHTRNPNGEISLMFATTGETSPPESLVANIDSTALSATPLESERFALLLIEYYAYGLAQAKRSLAASLASSIVGGVVLLGGVALAMTHSGAAPTVPIVTSLAGVITSGIGTLFHKQASEALKHMEGQSRGLRQDMKAERDQHQAVSMLERVADPTLKAQLQAALILQFTGAKVPNLPPVTGPASPPSN